MKGLIEWLSAKENAYFALHAFAVIVLSTMVEIAAPNATQALFPGIILAVAASFTYFYPVDAIKKQGIFAEYLIELRLLWLVLFGLLAEYAVYVFFEAGFNPVKELALVAGGIVLLVIAFYSRSRLQEKLVKARHWK